MADDTTSGGSGSGGGGIVVLKNTPIQIPQSAPSLSVRSVNVIPDSHNRSPGGLPMDIVEIEFYPFNQGNGDWMQWRDLSRFVCERGTADRLIRALGLTPSK